MSKIIVYNTTDDIGIISLSSETVDTYPNIDDYVSQLIPNTEYSVFDSDDFLKDIDTTSKLKINHSNKKISLNLTESRKKLIDVATINMNDELKKYDILYTIPSLKNEIDIIRTEIVNKYNLIISEINTANTESKIKSVKIKINDGIGTN